MNYLQKSLAVNAYLEYSYITAKQYREAELMGNIMNITHTVLLSCGTVGTVCSSTIDGQEIDLFIGEVLNVHLHDENGNPIEVEGVVEKILG